MTRTVRERIINLILVIVSGVAVSLFTSFQANKHAEKKDYTDKIEKLEREKLDKAEFTEHTKQQKIDRENDKAAVIEAVNEQGRETREWIELMMKKYNP